MVSTRLVPLQPRSDGSHFPLDSLFSSRSAVTSSATAASRRRPGCARQFALVGASYGMAYGRTGVPGGAAKTTEKREGRRVSILRLPAGVLPFSRADERPLGVCVREGSRCHTPSPSQRPSVSRRLSHLEHIALLCSWLTLWRLDKLSALTGWTESTDRTVLLAEATYNDTTTASLTASTPSQHEDAFQRRLSMLLKEQKLVLAPAPDANNRRRRAAMQKAAEVWALFRGKHSIDSELQKSRHLPEKNECEETVYRGITWPATPPDKCAEMDCPTWNVGIMTWCCNSRGYWKNQSPNTAQCVQPSVLLLKSQQKYLADIIETVSDFVSNNSLEVGGDLVAIVDLLDMGVVRSDTGDNYPGRIASAAQALRVGGLTASTVDELLSRDKPWNEVPVQTRHSCATTLLLIMDVAGIILSAASSEQKILAFINFQMNIISSTTTHIANQTMLLPAPGNNLNRTYSTAQLRIARSSSGAEEDSRDGDDGAGDVVIVFTEFPRLDKLLLDDGVDAEDPKQELNSPAISIRVGSEAPGLVLGAHVELALPMLHYEAENPTCVFWDTLIKCVWF
ncbi:hypothetical protein HPB49_004275 [Dermacentor silvarum]|uniref:Uncharacterized protein n=1 Tax=Dermacentor silvarum TaxID=543639 RepID=A0ACB8DAP3_DERSI|nr:hypothetical protein HPB49_004275 [Dermacentor silvarum]